MPTPDRELVIDLYAGGGGASEGIRRAIGRCPDVAVNHSAPAIRMHWHNHPDSIHLQTDVDAVDPYSVTGGRPVGLLWASPQCFPAGTLVFTDAGLVPIEGVRAGDQVLTHRGRWRPVVSTITKEGNTVEVRGYGHYGLVTTPDHPFYSKRITRRYPGRRGPEGKRPGTVRDLVENPYWPAAATMEGKLWATPHTFPDAAIPRCAGAEFSEDFFYWLGRWVGDGSISKGDVLICTGLSDGPAMIERFKARPLRRASGEIVEPRCQDWRTATMLSWANAPLVDWLRDNFGDSSDTKRLPTWVFAMQANWRRAFLDGYVDADGSVGARTETSSVSRALSVGIRLLAVSLGHAAALYLDPGRDGTIEGRAFVGRDQFRVAWREDLQRQTTLRDGLHLFTPVREVVSTGRRETVYCLEIEEDESYVADGIVVHNCTHHSRARGGKPKSLQQREQGWSVVRWARETSPRIIFCENVEEWQTWGPLHPDDHPDEALRSQPIAERRGDTWRAWLQALRDLGYIVEHRLLVACDFGAPTSRERLFVVARRDGQPITWPAPTHGAPPLLPYRTTAECLDWSIPMLSIFATREEAKAWAKAVGADGIPQRPLAEATQRRIAEGIRRFVLGKRRPFLVNLTHGGRLHDVAAPIPTVTAAHRGEKAVVAPSLVRTDHTSDGHLRGVASVEEALRTVTTSGGHALAAPILTKAHSHGWDSNGSGVRDIERPLGAVVAKDAHVVAAAHLLNLSHGGRPASLEEPVSTLTATPEGGDRLLVAAGLVNTRNGEREGQRPRVRDVEDVAPTVTAKGSQGAVAAAWLSRHNETRPGRVDAGRSLEEPAPTIAQDGQMGPAAVFLDKLHGSARAGVGVDEPAPTVTSGGGRGGGHASAVAVELAPEALGRAREVAAFLTVYYSGGGSSARVDAPLPTIVTHDRFGLVTVEVDGETYTIVDIAMRMLTPRELASCQGFPPTYVLTGTKSQQIERIGNSVSPPPAEALVRANFGAPPTKRRRREPGPLFDLPVAAK